MRANLLARYQVPEIKTKVAFNKYLKESFKDFKELLEYRESFYLDKKYFNKYIKLKEYQTAIALLWHIKSTLKEDPYNLD